MEFTKYPHLEKFGNEEVEGIENGTCFVFPKIDGTNSCVWLNNGELKAGSRNRELGLGKDDNAGFYGAIRSDASLREYLERHPSYIVYGEWLVPNQIKHYKEDAKRKFWIFDVYDTLTNSFVMYPYYESELTILGLSVIPSIALIGNGSLESFLEVSRNCKFLLKDNEQAYGEGVVIKRYDYINKYGRTTWAKIINDEYKEKKGIKQEAISFEDGLCEYACTGALVGKVHAKIMLENDSKWHPKFIGRLLGEVYHDVINEELWSFLKSNKKAIIDFDALKKLCEARTKEMAVELSLPLYEES